MNINFKYYIVTIGAIFIALGIGIFIGFNINNSESVAKQQTQMINDLDNHFAKLKTKNDELTDSLKQCKSNMNNVMKFMDMNSGFILNQRLTGTVSGIISYESDGGLSDFINAALQSAGGRSAFDIVITDSFAKKSVLDELNKKYQIKLNDYEDLMGYLLQNLSSHDNLSRVNELADLGMIKINKLDSDSPAYSCVIIESGKKVNGESDDYSKRIKYIVKKLKEQNKRVVYVKGTKSESDFTKDFRGDKVPTVNRIENKFFQTTLALVLYDKAVDHGFGADGEGQVIPVIDLSK